MDLGARTPARPFGGIAAFPPAWREGAHGNVVGGLLAALVTVPLSMGYGALAFAPFGPDYATRGVLAGLYAAAFLGLLAVLMGARGVAIYAPRSLVSVIIASVSAELFLKAAWLPHDDPDQVTAAIFLLVALAGAFQLAFGFARLARVVKFIPTPVMSGFQIAAAVIIMVSQLPGILGLASRPAWNQWGAAIAGIKPFSILVAVVVIALIIHGAKLTRRAPPLILGVVLGTMLHYGLLALGGEPWLGATLGVVPASFPDGRELAQVMLLTTRPGFIEALPAIVVGAASIALVASLDVLMSAKVVENLSGRRGNGTQELVSIGAANLVTPLLGGVAGSISLASTTTGYKAGARNSMALLVHGLAFLALVPVLGPLIGHMPRAVIAGLVFYAGIQLVDKWSVQVARRVVTGRTIHWKGNAIDLAVIVTVACVALSGQIVGAVLVGVAAAVVVFTLRMSRKVIRREQYGDTLQSRRARETGDATILASHGRSILAIELEGPLFFASAETLHNRVDAAIAEGVRHVVLDVSRVTELDSTGARILLQCDERLRAARCRLLVCGADARPGLAALMADHGISAALTGARLFPDLDRALERCEDELLQERRGTAATEGEAPLEGFAIARGLTAEGLQALRAAMSRREYEAGQVVFDHDDPGDALYVIARGSASAWIDGTRLMTFSRGTFFGEMALLDRERRSASVTADGPLACHLLERARFEALCREHPEVGLALLANLGSELSRRMRRTNRTVLELA
jgi:SulP family sulfate permease